MPAPLSKRALLERIAEAVYASGWNLLHEAGPSTHPFKLRIFKENEGHGLLIYIWSLTHGGGAARPKNEFRIQMTGLDSKLRFIIGYKTLLLGWHEGLKVFVGFDVQKHRRSTSRSPSIQVHFETLEKAKRDQIAFQRKGNDEIAVAFLPGLFAEYVSSQDSLHQFAASDDELAILERVVSGDVLTEESLIGLSTEREEVVKTITLRKRESDFRDRVLKAYENRCAMCDLQLRLLDAAHIIPVQEPGSNDLTCNGMALCKNHHAAYDNGVVKVDERYRIHPNQRKIDELAKMKATGGLEMFLKALHKEINLPLLPLDRPRPEYLRRGMELRGCI
jgi:putative restriction endonuclease